MAGGRFHASFLTKAWSTGRFGSMGLKGEVKLGYWDKLAATEDLATRLDN